MDFFRYFPISPTIFPLKRPPLRRIFFPPLRGLHVGGQERHGVEQAADPNRLQQLPDFRRATAGSKRRNLAGHK